MKLPTDVDFVLLVPPSHPYAKRVGERLSITFQVEPFATEPVWCDIKEIKASVPELKPIEFDPKLSEENRPWHWYFGGWMG